MDDYVNISLDLTICQHNRLDFRIATKLTIQQFLKIVSAEYHLQIDWQCPVIRLAHNGKILTSLKRFDEEPTLTNGALLIVEAL